MAFKVFYPPPPKKSLAQKIAITGLHKRADKILTYKWVIRGAK